MRENFKFQVSIISNLFKLKNFKKKKLMIFKLNILRFQLTFVFIVCSFTVRHSNTCSHLVSYREGPEEGVRTYILSCILPPNYDG